MRVWLALLFLSAGVLGTLWFHAGDPPSVEQTAPVQPPPGDRGERPPPATSPDPAPTPRDRDAQQGPAAPITAPNIAQPDPVSQTPPPGSRPAEEAPPPWGVQLAANFDREKALAQFARLREQFPSLLGAHAPTVTREKNLSFGRDPRFIVQMGAESRDAAEALCRRLRDSGGACIVIRN